MFLYYCKLALWSLQWEVYLSVAWTVTRELMGADANAGE